MPHNRDHIRSQARMSQTPQIPLPHRLSRIRMKQNVPLSTRRGNLPHGLYGPHLVIRRHDRDQRGIGSNGTEYLGSRDDSLVVDGYVRHDNAGCEERLRAVSCGIGRQTLRNGGMFNGGGDHVEEFVFVGLLSTGEQRQSNGEVVGFCAASRKDNGGEVNMMVVERIIVVDIWRRSYQRQYGSSGMIDGPFGLVSVVMRGGGIAEMLG
eukprot:CCRYP_016728-RA/>CCRYP_016728-RA protein AED:0.03 eAED:0.03 QI:1862/1/1/1/0.33/0.25/4/981/207